MFQYNSTVAKSKFSYDYSEESQQHNWYAFSFFNFDIHSNPPLCKSSERAIVVINIWLYLTLYKTPKQPHYYLCPTTVVWLNRKPLSCRYCVRSSTVYLFLQDIEWFVLYCKERNKTLNLKKNSLFSEWCNLTCCIQKGRAESKKFLSSSVRMAP